jgi:hypothetical protein
MVACHQLKHFAALTDEDLVQIGKCWRSHNRLEYVRLDGAWGQGRLP